MCLILLYNKIIWTLQWLLRDNKSPQLTIIAAPFWSTNAPNDNSYYSDKSFSFSLSLSLSLFRQIIPLINSYLAIAIVMNQLEMIFRSSNCLCFQQLHQQWVYNEYSCCTELPFKFDTIPINNRNKRFPLRRSQSGSTWFHPQCSISIEIVAVKTWRRLIDTLWTPIWFDRFEIKSRFICSPFIYSLSAHFWILSVNLAGSEPRVTMMRRVSPCNGRGALSFHRSNQTYRRSNSTRWLTQNNSKRHQILQSSHWAKLGQIHSKDKEKNNTTKKNAFTKKGKKKLATTFA